MITPYDVLTQVVDETLEGERSPQQLQAALEQFELHLAPHREQLNQMSAPLDYRELYAAAQEGYQLFDQALQILREYAETLDPAAAEEALELAGQGHQLLTEVQQESTANYAELDAEL